MEQGREVAGPRDERGVSAVQLDALDAQSLACHAARPVGRDRALVAADDRAPLDVGQPLDNLELFGMSPLYSLESYRAIGRNSAGYALGRRVGPVPTELDNFARAKLIVRTTLLHARETLAVVPDAPPLELELHKVAR